MPTTRSNAPLRRIVRRFSETVENADGVRVHLAREELSCGHVVAPRQDIYGPTDAIRRRCRRCGEHR